MLASGTWAIRFVGLCAVATTFGLCAGGSVLAADKILIFGGTDHDQFLGCLSCSEFDGDSIWNAFSEHGWANKFGTWNRFGEYANPFGGSSACNKFASEGPVIVDEAGGFYGVLTVNEFAQNSVCGVAGDARTCRALNVMCASD